MIEQDGLIQNEKATGGQVTIDILPDDVLLCVFDHHLDEATDVEEWCTLIHVCRRWKNIVLGSSRRLRLRIAFTSKSNVKKLDVWPDLPIVVSGYCHSEATLNNIKAALKHSDRICQIKLAVHEKIWIGNAFQKSFPALTDLDLSKCPFTSISLDPGRLKFSSHLRSLSLAGITMPKFPTLLASFVDLNNLRLHDIRYWFFEPDAMATALSTLTSLERLSLGFKTGQSLDNVGDQASQHPLPCSVIPSLFCFDYKGDSEYLEALVARIDTPVLHRLDMTLFCRPRDTTQLRWYLNRIPNMQAFDKALVKLDTFKECTEFSSTSSDLGGLIVRIFFKIDLFQPFAQCFGLPFIPTPESLYIVIYSQSRQPPWLHFKNAEWVNLLRPFVAVKNLHLSNRVVSHIAPALGDLFGARATEVLPALQKIVLEESSEPAPSRPSYHAIMQFAAARRLSGRPIHITYCSSLKY